MGPLKVLEKIGRLAYRLDVPFGWKIHPVVSIAQLEPAPPGEDPWARPKPDNPGPVEAGDAANSYEIEKIVRKRVPRARGRHRTQYLVRWQGRGPEWDEWIDAEDMDQAKELVREFESLN